VIQAALAPGPARTVAGFAAGLGLGMFFYPVYEPPMRIEVSVPGIRKERGKLPAPTTLGPLRIGLPPAVGSTIWGELVDAAPYELVTGAEVGEPFATGSEQPASSVSATASPAIAAAAEALAV
jgi:hypothetical protein